MGDRILGDRDAACLDDTVVEDAGNNAPWEALAASGTEQEPVLLLLELFAPEASMQQEQGR